MDKERPIGEDEINLLDLLIVLVKRAKLILALTFGCALITGLISIILPPIYKAETRILPPYASLSNFVPLTQVAQRLEQLKQLPISLFINPRDLLDLNPELYIGIIKSNTLLDRLIERFQLLERYKTKNKEDVRKTLLGNLNVSVDKKSGIITIGVYDRDPKFAADLANAFVEELGVVIKGLALTESAKRRLFFEEQLKEVREAVTKAEEKLRAFQEKIKVQGVDEQTKEVIEGIANLRAQITAKEIKIKVMRAYLTSNNPDLKRAEDELQTLRMDLEKLEAKSKEIQDLRRSSEKTLPEVSEYLNLWQEFKFYEVLYELLQKEYEKAKLEEVGSVVVIQVIDKAIPPEKKAKPKRMQMVLLATFIGFFVSILLAFILEFIEKAKADENNRQRLETLRTILKQRWF